MHLLSFLEALQSASALCCWPCTAHTAGASLLVEQGEQLLAANWPAVHTVGRAAARPPVVLDINWQPPSSSSSAGADDLPLVALVGKGVCFDSGGRLRCRSVQHGTLSAMLHKLVALLLR